MKQQLSNDIIEAVQAGHSTSEIAVLIGKEANYTSSLLTELVQEGKLTRLGKGKYAVKTAVPNTNGIRPYAQNGSTPHMAESVSRRVMLPDYMKTRAAITLYVERSPEEIEGVMRLELCVNGAWLPIPVTSDLRLCVGDDIPRWSATQEVYNDVKAFRITRRDGSQAEYPHNAAVPLTVDRKVQS